MSLAGSPCAVQDLTACKECMLAECHLMSPGGSVFLLSWCASGDVLCLTMNIFSSADYIFMFYLFFLVEQIST